MQLIYRGHTYNYNAAQATARLFYATRTAQTARELIYRGSSYRVTPTTTTKRSIQANKYELIYQGNTYQINRNEQGEVTAIIPCGNSYKHRKKLAKQPAV